MIHRRRTIALPAAVALLAAVHSSPVRAEAPAPASPPPSAPPPASALWHLPVSADGLRVVGEGGNLLWPIYIPPQTAPTLKRFQLGYQAAIAVMPEASGITLTMNGQIIGRTPIAAPTGVKTLAFDIPPGIALPGWNTLGLAVSERHRVDCSIASTYDLWTQIDPSSTGFVGGPPPLTSLADLPAVAPDEKGATQIHLLLPKDPSPTDLGRAVRAVERVALRGRFAHPVIDTVPGPTGITVAVGMTGALGGMAAGPSRTRDPIELKATAAGAPLLVFSGDTDSELDRVIEDFGASAPEPIGGEDGLDALARRGGLHLRPGESLSFAEMGIPSRTFSGRLYHETFDVILPPDAYPADYAEAHLTIEGGYAPGLTSDARLTVRVNGVLDGNLDFNDPGGAVLHGQIIHMPLNPFHPGHNRIEIQAELPAHADETCDSLSAIGAKERFLLLGTSRLGLPTLARVAQFPSLSASLTGNMRVTPSVPPRLFLPRATDGVVSAVSTLLANASIGAGAPADALFLRGTPQPGPGPAILIGDPSDMPALLLTSAGIDADAMASAWRPGTGRPRLGFARTTAEAAEHTRSDNGRLDAWGQRVDTGGGWLGDSGDILPTLGTKFVQSLRMAGLVPYPDRLVGVTGDTSFVVAQGMLDETPLTIVTARDEKALAAGAAAITDPSRLSSLDGRAASIEDGSHGLTLVAAHDTTFFRTQGFSFSNDRLVAAGWVSKHAAWYIGAVLLSVLFLGASTYGFLVFGRPKEAP